MLVFLKKCCKTLGSLIKYKESQRKKRQAYEWLSSLKTEQYHSMCASKTTHKSVVNAFMEPETISFQLLKLAFRAKRINLNFFWRV